MSITNSSNKLIALATGVAVAIALMGAAAVAPAQAAGLTQTQIQSIVSLLASFGADQGTINNVTAALNGQATTGTGGSTGTSGACPALTRDLTVGSTGTDVMSLQQFLNSSVTTQIASAGAGSPGNESTYFGSLTKAAVIKFQTANGVAPNVGYVGPITRAAIAAVCGKGGTTTGGGTTGGTTTGGSVTVSAGVQPQNSLAPQGAARVPFTTFTLTNSTSQPVTINSVTVQRTGLGVDQNLSGITLLDQNGLQIGTAQTLNSNHQANIGSIGFTIPANSSAMFTVAGNIATGQSTNGQVISIEVVAVNTGASVSGALPITGASQTINNTLTLGSVSTSTSSFDPGSNTTHNIGDTNVRFSGIKFTAGSAEDLKLYSMRWRQVGTAGSGDISNVVTVVNGTSYPTTVDSTGKYYTSTFPGGILIPKGNSVDVYVQGNLSGTNNNLTVIFNVDKVTDVYFVGQLYGYGISPTGTFQPWYSGYTTTIQGGTLTTISKSGTGLGAAQNVAINVNNQAMGGFTTNFSGEPVTVNGMTFTIATSSLTSSGSGTFTTVSLVNSNGTVVAGPVDAVMAASGETLTFTDTVTFPTGSQSYYLEGKIPSAVTGGSFYVTTTPSSWSNPTGQSTGNTISLSGSGTITMNSMTVKPGSLSVSYASTPSSQNVVAGTSQLVLANLNLDASQSGENVRLASIPVNFTGTTADLSGCQLWNGAPNTGSPLNNQALNTISSSQKNVFNLQNSLTVPKGTIVTLSLACNISGSAANNDSFHFTMDSTTGDWAVTGATSGQSITPTFISGSSAGTMTVQTASLALSVDSSSPASTTVSGGSTGQTVAVYNLIGSNDNITLTQLGMTLSGSAKASDVTTVWLYDSSNHLLGSATFGSGQTTATSTLNGSGLALSPNTNTRITVKADIADVGTFKPGTEGDIIAIDPSSAQGNGSSGQINTGATGTTAGVRLYNSFPTFTYATNGGTATNGVNTLMTFTVSADPAGDVGLYQLKFLIATTTSTVTSVTFNGPSGAVGSASSYAPDPSSDVTVLFNSTSNTSDATVPAGTSKTYTMQGTVTLTGTNTTGSVSTSLLADTSAQNTMTKAASVSGNIVWSPLATTTLDRNTNDWTNGYALTKGCFATVGLANNCTSNVISK